MKAITTRVEDELHLGVRRRALESGVTVQEVGLRLFEAYADGTIAVRGRVVGEGEPSGGTQTGRSVGVAASSPSPTASEFPDTDSGINGQEA